MPSFPSLPTVPSIDFTGLDAAKLAETARTVARDAAYVMIGAGVLAVREVQIRTRDIVAKINPAA